MPTRVIRTPTDLFSLAIQTGVSEYLLKHGVLAVADLGCTPNDPSPSVAADNRNRIQNYFNNARKLGEYHAPLLVEPVQIFTAGRIRPLERQGVSVVGLGGYPAFLPSNVFGDTGVTSGGLISRITRIDCSNTIHAEDEVFSLPGGSSIFSNLLIQGAEVDSGFTVIGTKSNRLILVEGGNGSFARGRHTFINCRFSVADGAVEFAGNYDGVGGAYQSSTEHADHTRFYNCDFYGVRNPILQDNVNSVDIVLEDCGVSLPTFDSAHAECVVCDSKQGGGVIFRNLVLNCDCVCIFKYGEGGNWSQNSNRFEVQGGRYDTPSTAYATGTVSVSAGVATLTGGTWPAWAAQGTLRISNRRYKVNTRDSDTQITLYDTSASESAGSSYSIVRASLTLFRNAMAASHAYREVSVRVAMLLAHAAQDNNVVDPALGPAYDPKYLVELGEARVPATGSSSLMPYNDLRFDLTNLPRINYPAPHGLTWTESPHGFKLA